MKNFKAMKQDALGTPLFLQVKNRFQNLLAVLANKQQFQQCNLYKYTPFKLNNFTIAGN
jgi:hypothetical protein